MKYDEFDPNYLKYTKYPSGELRVPYHWGEIIARLQTAEDILALLLAIDKNEYTDLIHIPYFPFAREDKDTGDTIFTLKRFCDLINYKKMEVVLYDPHSDVAPALLDYCHVREQHYIAAVCFSSEFAKYDYIVAPDSGATKKASRIANHFNKPLVQCLKHRNPSTGELSNFQVLAGRLDNKKCLIVDDICDGGGTFLGIESKLRELGATTSLYVTHGLFTKGFDALHNAFDEIYTTNTWIPSTPRPDYIKVGEIVA